MKYLKLYENSDKLLNHINGLVIPMINKMKKDLESVLNSVYNESAFTYMIEEIWINDNFVDFIDKSNIQVNKEDLYRKLSDDYKMSKSEIIFSIYISFDTFKYNKIVINNIDDIDNIIENFRETEELFQVNKSITNLITNLENYEIIDVKTHLSPPMIEFDMKFDLSKLSNKLDKWYKNINIVKL